MLSEMTIDQFKEALGVPKIDLIVNKKTGKPFGVAGVNRIKVYQFELTPEGTPEGIKAMETAVSKARGWKVLVEDGDLDEAVIVPGHVGAKVIVEL